MIIILLIILVIGKSRRVNSLWQGEGRIHLMRDPFADIVIAQNLISKMRTVLVIFYEERIPGRQNLEAFADTAFETFETVEAPWWPHYSNQMSRALYQKLELAERVFNDETRIKI